MVPAGRNRFGKPVFPVAVTGAGNFIRLSFDAMFSENDRIARHTINRFTHFAEGAR